MKNLSGTTVAHLDRGGNFRLAGKCCRYADIVLSSGAEFVVKSASGDPIALIDSAGNLFLKGVTHENLASVAPASGTEFSVKTDAGQTLLRIDDTGNAYLLGQVLDSSL